MHLLLSPLLLSLLLTQLVLRLDGALQHGGTNNPRWYVLMGEDDFPEEHSNHSIVKANVKEYDHVAQHGRECLGLTGAYTYPDVRGRGREGGEEGVGPRDVLGLAHRLVAQGPAQP